MCSFAQSRIGDVFMAGWGPPPPPPASHPPATTNHNAVRLSARRRQQSPDRFVRWFVGKDECLVVDRNKVIGADLTEHLPRLFRRCVGTDIWLIRADREDRYVDPAAGEIGRA